MEKVQISMNAEGDQKTFRRYVERALQWRLWQDVFGHHRVDKPRYYDKEDEINRCLKFGFFAACVLTVLHLIMYGWVLTWTSSSCEDISGFPETCPMWKFIYYKLWEYWSDSIGPNGIALLAIFKTHSPHVTGFEDVLMWMKPHLLFCPCILQLLCSQSAFSPRPT